MCDSARRKTEGEDRVESTNLFAIDKHGTEGHAEDVLLQTFRAWTVAEADCYYVRGIIDGGS